MKNISKKYLFYGFIALNIVAVVYLYFSDYKIDPKMLKAFLTTEYFLISYIVYILILIIRGLTLLPGTAFLLAGIYVFSFIQVYFAIQIAIISYCLIIYNFAHKLNFKVPKKILDYEHKIKTKEIPIIFTLCFIPGISINVLVYFLSIIDIKLKNILIGVVAGTSITSIIYISIITGVYESVDLALN
ncbi:VTT domain-containing protein [Candidatus Thioglobus sp.]|uniref:VTT domain-containing protein n=1 Tax=Candidatus Thioglobus sp. TaxID=2026721 RepID=UPI003D128D72